MGDCVSILTPPTPALAESAKVELTNPLCTLDVIDSSYKPHLPSKCQVTSFYCKYFINRNAVLPFRKYTSPINI